jgi:hypothetical protein
MLKLVRALPFARIFAIAQVALIARRHLKGLTAADRGRMIALVRRGRRMTSAERSELRTLVAKLEPRAFLSAAARSLAPFRVPGGRRRRR